MFCHRAGGGAWRGSAFKIATDKGKLKSQKHTLDRLSPSKFTVFQKMHHLVGNSRAG
ncbi:hypothetical protein [Moraxella lacunata]|uniref:hypothetical protein n=1 Tax=Moraxella lacunata TaxID=477 RepID=UPI003EDEF450